MKDSHQKDSHQYGAIFLAAILISVIYLLFCVYVLFGRDLTAAEMPLNEIGDALAGAFAPLAFGWLVLGFYQQAKELRLNSQELKNSVDQFSSQSESMKETNELEKRKLAMAEWDRLHLEMSSILASYLYAYSSDKIRKEIKNRRFMAANKGDIVAYEEKSISEFVEQSWVRYSQGDKNTFFRTVNAHTSYSNKESLENFFAAREGKRGRYLQLQSKLTSLYQDDLLINNHYVSEEMIGVANYLSSLN